MKKLISIAAISLFSLCSMAEKYMFTHQCSESKEIQQTSNWECLGDVTGVSSNGQTCSGKLYVKVIGQREFYKVRVFIGGDYKDCNLTIGNYILNNKHYNAQFTLNILIPQTFYLNI